MNFQRLSRAHAATLHFWRGIFYFAYNLNSIEYFLTKFSNYEELVNTYTLTGFLNSNVTFSVKLFI